MKDVELEKFFNLLKQIYRILIRNNTRYFQRVVCRHHNIYCGVHFFPNQLRFYNVYKEIPGKSRERIVYDGNILKGSYYLEMVIPKDFEILVKWENYADYPVDPYMKRMRDLIIGCESLVDIPYQVVDYYINQIQSYEVSLTKNKYLFKQILRYYKKHIPTFLDQLENFILEIL